MRAVDTNVLVRFFMDDNRDQAAKARRIFETSRDRREPLLIVPHVLCELVWVLTVSFQLSKAEIVDILLRILVADVFLIERVNLVTRALEHYKAGRADFSDYLLGEIATASGCRDTVTFDKGLRGATGFTPL